MPTHSLLFSKAPRGPPGLTSPSDGLLQKISTLYNFYQCRVLSDRLVAILSGETELAFGTIRVKVTIQSIVSRITHNFIKKDTAEYRNLLLVKHLYEFDKIIAF